jgi:uncharacterized protein
MGLLLFLVITEVLTIIVLRQHFFSSSKIKYYVSIIIHFILSIWLWILFFEVTNYKSFFDTPQHIWLKLNFTAMIIGVVIPRAVLSLCHFTGSILRIKQAGHINWLTNAGIIFMALILSIITLGTLHGRFNFKTENVTIKVKGLNKDLEGLRIVQLSDLHLASFFHHPKLLQNVINDINALKPDLILNTGDFVSYGWREFARNDTILVKAKSKYGNFAVMGNHDFGTYNPDFNQTDRDSMAVIMNRLIQSSGYKVLNDEYSIVNIGSAKIGLIGLITMGRFPDMLHGNLDKAVTGLDSVDFKILLDHDPNHWEEAVTGKTDTEITLSGHTHGMQMGIITKKFKWSPAKYFYPHWNGLYKEGAQFQYVNRGLGALAIPFRIGMPPEITIITLTTE